jgi:hypothetical protein
VNNASLINYFKVNNNSSIRWKKVSPDKALFTQIMKISPYFLHFSLPSAGYNISRKRIEKRPQTGVNHCYPLINKIYLPREDQYCAKKPYETVYYFAGIGHCRASRLVFLRQ